jgi:hypothetical protein
VLPQLGHGATIVGSEEDVGAALRLWLSQFSNVEVCVDYVMDFELFSTLARDPETLELPPGVTGRNIRNELSLVDIEEYWRENGRQMHHALHDAKANRFAYLKFRQARESTK